ncbi:MAG: long-chain fatty acid--CoA ligase [Ignavibacteriota bacterium]|nr:long-chain fatty acid--CoA ligase [Ignavibacteriota bacterium]MCO6446700.1 long-chain fatty acid--CoA ligase [Ignavibacterium album]MCZ2268184.1 long-chain fatty acid--CoA ligase [Ignavibacteriales bacterium]QKJ98854.1 MAG: long-chain fatty acid--CoA ligase [Ignavibacteriota bacterium]HOJ08732.1 long-chain fatty acid--CoA ligase [Ignavibacteriaceae bacterium]
MAAFDYLTTIPRLYQYLTEEYSKETNNYVIKHKVDGKYVGISYDQLKEETDAFAFGLASLGIKKDDKVAIISENRPEWVYSDMAILSLGAIDVPLYPSLTAESVEFILNNSESKIIIVSTKFQLNKVMKVRDKCKTLKFIILLNEKDYDSNNKDLINFSKVQESGRAFQKQHPSLLKDNVTSIKPSDICTIIYTSGTTGEPKGVVLTHHNILSNVEAALQSFPISNKDVFLSFLPLCHIFERMAGYYTAFSAKCTVCYAESIETVAQNLIEVKPTIMTTVPRLFERIHSKIIKNVESQSEKKQKIFFWAMEAGKKYREAEKNKKIPLTLKLQFKLADKLVYKTLQEKTGGNLRFFISGGAALPRALGEFFEAIGIKILEGYGLTESSPVIAANRYDDYKFGSVGKPFPGVEVKIASDGEILARGPNIMQGYYKNKKDTEATVKDGWLYTGDIGVFDADGFLIITDRKKHLFKTSTGKYIAPTPIESLFLASKYIDQFVLIGDRRMFLTALIVPDFEAVKEYADAHKIPYEKVEDLVRDEEIYKMLDKEMDQFQKKLANYERVRKFILLDKPFTIESGEITPSLKIKRKYVEERYQDLIEQMYQSLDKSVPIN